MTRTGRERNVARARGRYQGQANRVSESAPGAPLSAPDADPGAIAPEATFVRTTGQQGAKSGGSAHPSTPENRTVAADPEDSRQVASTEPVRVAACGGFISRRQGSATEALLFRANRAMNGRAAETILNGLPAEVVDGLVEDLAEAVVAMLLQRKSVEAPEEDDASGNLRAV